MRKSQLIVVSAVIGGLSALVVNGVMNFSDEAQAQDATPIAIVAAPRGDKDDNFRGAWVLRRDGKVFFCKVRGYEQDSKSALPISPGCIGAGTAG